MIGPILPFRGGLAQHTTMLHRALCEVADVYTVSFTRQYPRWLFPGESDRDPQFDGHVEHRVDYLIDSLNPLTWRTALKRCLAHRPKTVIIPWWTVYWAPCFRYLAKGFRQAGVDVTFLCHNVIEHESALWKKRLTRAVLHHGTQFIVHSNEGGMQLQSIVPEATVFFYPHPIYDHFPAAQGMLPRRSALELLFFGFVRPYKGLDILIESLALLEDIDVRLTAVGEFWRDREQAEDDIHRLGLEGRVELIARYVDDAEAAEYFHRADAVVLPYRNATGSGIVPLAYHYERPVIVTDVGGLPDVVEDGETGFVVEPNSPRALAQGVRCIADTNRTLMRSAIREYKQRMTWSGLAQNLVSSLSEGSPTAATTIAEVGPATLRADTDSWRPIKPR